MSGKRRDSKNHILRNGESQRRDGRYAFKLKTFQYLMGHSDIGVTLNTYTHIGYDDAKKELERVAKAE